MPMLRTTVAKVIASACWVSSAEGWHWEEPSEIGFLNLFLKILNIVCSPNGNKKCHSTQFSENDEIVFHLAVMSQCEQGGEGHI